MPTLRRTCALTVLLPSLCASLLAVSAHAGQSSFTLQEDLRALFDVEGDAPYASPDDGTLRFSALASRFASPNGHGYRNELKIASRHRRPIAQTRERFSAVVTPTLPDGARTIVAQYHVDGIDTILKVYVQDTADGQLFDGKAGNGIFDVVVKMRGADGKEVKTALGTVRSGVSFALAIRFDKGEATVAATTTERGSIQATTRIPGDNRNIYFKFGDYLQALDAETGKHTSSRDKWDAYFRRNQIGSSQVVFANTIFVRD